MRNLRNILIISLAVAPFLFAGKQERIIWHRSYFAALGIDAMFSSGDLDGFGKFEAEGDDGSADETVYVPYMGSFPLPVAELGVNINQHTISVSFGMWQPSINFGKETDDYEDVDANYWRFAAEYRYFFFWPEDFEVGPGLAYSFSRFAVHDAAFGENRNGEYQSEAVYAGNAFAASANLRYKLKPFGIDVAFRYRGMFFRSVTTDEGGYSDLSKTLWQNVFEISAKAFYEF